MSTQQAALGGAGSEPHDPVSPQASRSWTLGAGPLTTLAAIVLILIGILALKATADLVVPVMFGLFLALVTAPLVGTIERRGVRHSLALTIAVSVLVVIVLAVAGVIAFSVAELVARMPGYEDRLTTLADDARELLAQFGIVADPNAIPTLSSPGTLLTLVRPVAAAVSNATIAIFVLAATMVFALTGSASLGSVPRRPSVRSTPSSWGWSGSGWICDATSWCAPSSASSRRCSFSSCCSSCGCPSRRCGPSSPSRQRSSRPSARSSPSCRRRSWRCSKAAVVTAGLVVGGFTLINVAQDYLLQPRMMGTELNLTALVVFLSVVVWAWILGASGALLAVPLTVGLVAILDASPSSEGHRRAHARPGGRAAGLDRSTRRPGDGSRRHRGDPDSGTDRRGQLTGEQVAGHALVRLARLEATTGDIE